MKEMPVRSADLKKMALELGFQSVGVCRPVPAPHLREYQSWLSAGRHGTMAYLVDQLHLKRSPAELLPEVQSVIAVALNYNQPVPIQRSLPRIARYALGRDYHKVIRSKLKRIQAWIEERHPGAKCRPCVDSAPIFERDYARLAGLGWFGKNTCLIDSKRGSWFFIGLLLTSVDFEKDEPAMGSCGTCRKCIEACPTGAIVWEEDRWQVDSRRCISYLTIEHKEPIQNELEPKVGEWTFGCDICQEVCPFNEERDSQPLRAQTTESSDFLATRSWPSLRELAEISYVDWDALTRGSAVRRAGWEGLRRNARINLQNESRAPTPSLRK